MKIGMLGSGIVGRNVGGALVKAGEKVVLGTRTPDDLDGPRGRDGQTLRQWMDAGGEHAQVGTFAEAAAFGDVVVNATNGAASMDALAAAGAENLEGKILIDIANPLDFSKGMPPTLLYCNDDSLGERIQAAYPQARVVKTLNTTNTMVMTDPGQVGDGEHTMFVAGNDADAKADVTRWLHDWFGWKDVLDVGDMTAARGMEMVLPLWVRLMGTLGTAAFNFRIVR